MYDFKTFDEIVKIARTETAPTVHVTQGVLGKIETMQDMPQEAFSMWIFAGFALATAIFVVVFSQSAWNELQDPLFGLFSPFTLMLQ